MATQSPQPLRTPVSRSRRARVALLDRLRGRRAAAVVALALSPTALLAIMGWTHRWNSEDSFIDFRVVDQLLHGNGPVFNVGERVEAYTSPLWVALLSAGSAIVGLGHVEWLAVGLGIGFTALGLATATIAALVLNGGASRRDGLLLPLGALAFAVLPPAWDFVTSGLESGLALGWLGTTYLVTVLVWERTPWRLRRLSRERAADAAAVLAGLGVLVRPDFAIFTVAFLGLIVVLAGPRTRRVVVRRILLAAALPVLYELFRVAYFAVLVPNTALAKEASKTDWSRGADYLWNTLKPYALLAPLLGLSLWSVAIAVEDRLARRSAAAALRIVPVVAGLLFILYLVAIGGDFMHARLLLPAIFAILMPVAVVPVRARAVDIGWAGALAAWAAACGFGLRGPTQSTPFGVEDERAFYLNYSERPHPVTLRDYAKTPWAQVGGGARIRAARGDRVVSFYTLDPKGMPDAPLAPGSPRRFVFVAGNVGLIGYAAGRDVFVVDQYGLADPVASRLRLVSRLRAGHEKSMEMDWAVGRFADRTRWRAGEDTSAAIEAQRALGCDGLARVLRDVRRPLTLGQALTNAGDALANTRLRFDPQPALAAPELCRDPGR